MITMWSSLEALDTVTLSAFHASRDDEAQFVCGPSLSDGKNTPPPPPHTHTHTHNKKQHPFSTEIADFEVDKTSFLKQNAFFQHIR